MINLIKEELIEDTDSLNVYIYVWYQEKMYVSKIISVSQLIPSIITFTKTRTTLYYLQETCIILIIAIVNQHIME